MEKKLLKSSVIDCLWILDKDSGLCIFEREYKSTKELAICSNLISGFLNAISTFIDETFSEGIEVMNLSNRKIYFNYTEELMFVVLFSSSFKASMNQFDNIMNKIIKNFYRRFGEAFTETFWCSKPYIFKSFEEELDSIISGTIPVAHFLEML